MTAIEAESHDPVISYSGTKCSLLRPTVTLFVDSCYMETIHTSSTRQELNFKSAMITTLFYATWLLSMYMYLNFGALTVAL